MDAETAIAASANSTIAEANGEQSSEFSIVEPSTYGDRPTCFSNTVQECLFVLTTTMAVGQDAIFQGGIICISSFIGNDLNMSAAEVTWISAGQNLAAGCFLPLFGRFADLFGRRITFLTSMIGFSASLLVMGFATNAYYMDVCCAFCGVFSAMAVPPAIGKLGAVYPKPSRRKNQAFACFSAGNPVGFGLGAFISGVTTSISTWRTAFWVMCVIYSSFSIIAFFTVPFDTEQKTGGFNRATFAQFDSVGAILVLAGTGIFTASLTLAGSAPDGWRSGYVVVLLLVGVFLIGAFIYWQSICSHPLMPLFVWRDRNFTLLVSTLCIGSFGNGFWVTLYWQRVQQNTPILVAVKLLPMMIGGLAMNIIAALVMHRVSNKFLMFIGAISFVLSNILFSVARKESSYWAYYFLALLLCVVGADLEFTVTNMYVMSTLPSEQQSVAGALLNTMARLAATIGIGIQTSVYNALGGSAFGKGAQLYRPYQSTFWVSLAGAGLALVLVPFLTIKRQGVKAE